MNSTFAKMVESFEPKLTALKASTYCSPLLVPRDAPTHGIYVFFEGRKALYVGRSNRLRKRLGNHCREGASHKMAAFAFRLAREASGNHKASYKPEGSRQALMKDPTFVKAFIDAKGRIRNMSVKFVEERDPTRQALLEIYIAVAMKTRYNDFDTH